LKKEDKCSLSSSEIYLQFNLKVGRSQFLPEKISSTTAIELDSLSFLENTSNCREQPKKKKMLEARSQGNRKWNFKQRQC
jgi:hypothetical protein